MNKIEKCKKCELYKNQPPLLDEIKESEIMWVGLSAKKVDNINETHPLANDTNTGRIIEQIENELNQHSFYKTNLVKCVPLNETNKLRYPTTNEMEECLENLIYEISLVKPKVILVLGKQAYNFIIKKAKIKNIFYIEHPSYIYVYKRKEINSYIEKVKKLIESNI